VKTKDLAVGVVFGALAIALNFLIRIPDPPAPFLFYQIWEIPILAAFFLFGVFIMLFVTAINFVILLVFFQGASVLGPVYWLAAWFSMVVGIGLIKILHDKHALKNVAVTGALYTAFGVAFRTAVMTLVNYTVLRYPPPVGYSEPQLSIVTYFVPQIALFNALLALYTIPISFSISQTLARNIRMFR